MDRIALRPPTPNLDPDPTQLLEHFRRSGEIKCTSVLVVRLPRRRHRKGIVESCEPELQLLRVAAVGGGDNRTGVVQDQPLGPRSQPGLETAETSQAKGPARARR